jgi:endonuclease I
VLNDPGFAFRQQQQQTLFFLQKVRPATCSVRSFKRPGRDIGHLPPACTEVNNERNCTADIDRDNFSYMRVAFFMAVAKNIASFLDVISRSL